MTSTNTEVTSASAPDPATQPVESEAVRSPRRRLQPIDLFSYYADWSPAGGSSGGLICSGWYRPRFMSVGDLSTATNRQPTAADRV